MHLPLFCNNIAAMIFNQGKLHNRFVEARIVVRGEEEAMKEPEHRSNVSATMFLPILKTLPKPISCP